MQENRKKNFNSFRINNSSQNRNQKATKFLLKSKKVKSKINRIKQSNSNKKIPNNRKNCMKKLKL